MQVRATTTDQVVAVLQIEVVSQPFVVDARLHFHAAQGELMNARIPVAQHMCPAWRSGEGVAGQWSINCTEPNAVVGVTRTGLQNALAGTRPGPDVHLRYRARSQPTEWLLHPTNSCDSIQGPPPRARARFTLCFIVTATIQALPVSGISLFTGRRLSYTCFSALLVMRTDTGRARVTW